jgi:protein SCO1/2
MRLAPVALAAAMTACSTREGAEGRRYPLTGTVVGHEASPSRVVVAHEAVAGLMPAMSMPFEVAGAAPATRDGDRIAATLVVTTTRSWLEDVKITAASSVPARGVAAVRSAAPGVLVPPLALIDQRGQPFTLQSFAGRVLVVTFIYTRCPLPDFCPLMIAHLESVRQRANQAGVGGRLALLAVTLDPAYDTPAVLQAFGESRLKGERRFDHWTLATGTPAQIDSVASLFGVRHQNVNGTVTHTLATAVLGHDGRIMRVFESNSWRPDELFDVVSRGVERASAE